MARSESDSPRLLWSELGSSQWVWTTEDLGHIQWVDTGTAGSEIAVSLSAPMTGTVTPVSTQELGYRRARARADYEEAGTDHKDGHLKEWERRTGKRVRLSTEQILEEIAELGFAWRDVARLLGVTVQAVQKWRRGEGASSSNRYKAAGLLAACDLISENYEVQEIASWFEIPLLPGIAISPIDLWCAQRPDLVFDYASGHVEAEQVLDSWQPDWRTQYSSSFEVFEAGDGRPSIRLKDQ